MKRGDNTTLNAYNEGKREKRKGNEGGRNRGSNQAMAEIVEFVARGGEEIKPGRGGKKREIKRKLRKKEKKGWRGAWQKGSVRKGTVRGKTEGGRMKHRSRREKKREWGGKKEV